MIINKPDAATGSVWIQDIDEDVWSILARVGGELPSVFEDSAPSGAGQWGDVFKVTVTVEKV